MPVSGTHERGAGYVIEFIKDVVELLGYFSQPVFNEKAREAAKRRKGQDKSCAVHSVTELRSAEHSLRADNLASDFGEEIGGHLQHRYVTQRRASLQVLPKPCRLCR